jgi:branched-chain amino acid transport system ATP-binding protein
MSKLLEVKALSAFYGSTRVLHGVDCSVAEDRVTAVLGANGAGKTTLLRAISSMIRTTGEIFFCGRRIDGKSTEAIARSGVAHVPDGRGTLTDLTVEENLLVGAYTRRDRSQVRKDFEQVYAYFPRLKERRSQQAGTLSGGEQQMLAISRALLLKPKLLLMDEPSFGLAPLIIREIFSIMKTINETEKIGILLVEQNVARALDLATDVFLLETGRVVMTGSSEEFAANEMIRRSYLGG